MTDAQLDALDRETEGERFTMFWTFVTAVVISTIIIGLAK